jgi:hypothetical protein
MNQLHEIYNAKPCDVLVFSGDTPVNDVYLEAYTNDKIVSIDINPAYQNLIVTFLNIEQCTNILICEYLCKVFSYTEDNSVFLKLPATISLNSLRTCVYKTIRSMDIAAKVVIEGNTLVLVKKKPSLDIPLDKIMVRILTGETVEIPLKVNEDITNIRSLIYQRARSLGIKTSVIKYGHNILVSKVPDTGKFIKPATSVKSLFNTWVNNLEWDTPSEYLPATTTNDDYRHFCQLAGQNPLGCIKAKRGLFTKHSLCIAKDNGIVVVRYMGDIIYRTGSRSVKELTSNDITGINLALSSLNKTYEDLI